MAFALPQSSETGEQSGGKTATEAREQDMIAQEATRHIAAKGRRADPRMVADRVYDLMREEARLTRSRGGI